jgi:hypothetical protein
MLEHATAPENLSDKHVAATALQTQAADNLSSSQGHSTFKSNDSASVHIPSATELLAELSKDAAISKGAAKTPWERMTTDVQARKVSDQIATLSPEDMKQVGQNAATIAAQFAQSEQQYLKQHPGDIKGAQQFAHQQPGLYQDMCHQAALHPDDQKIVGMLNATKLELAREKQFSHIDLSHTAATKRAPENWFGLAWGAHSHSQSHTFWNVPDVFPHDGK